MTPMLSPKRSVASLTAAVLAAAALAGCAESERDSESGGGGGDDGTFVFGAAGAPEMFDPFYATDGETFRVTRQMFEGLVGIKPGTAEVVPELATEWTPNDEGTEWTFTLRDDVTFHDGEPFNAEAVCYNFERMFDQNEAGQTAGEYWGYVMGAFANDADNSLYQGCEATGDYEAVISTSGPTSGFPTMLSLESLSMQSPKALEGLGRLHRQRLQRQHRGEAGRRAAGGDHGLVVTGGLAALVERVVGVVGEGAHHVAPVLAGGLAGLVLVEHPLEVVADRLGVERLAVVEGHVVAQREGPLGALVVGRPLGGELGDHLGRAGLDAHQALEHLAGDAERLAVGGVEGIEHLGSAGCTEDEGAVVAAATTALGVALALRTARQRGSCEHRGGE